MQIIKNIDEINIKGCSVALGTFDGLHKGHMAVINTALQAARKYNCLCAVVSVQREDEHLLTFDGFCDRLEKSGVDVLIALKLHDIRDISAQDFIDGFLVGRLDCVHVSCGFNCRFGKGAQGDVKLLFEKCREYGIGFIECEPITYMGEAVSSTGIRKALHSGDIELASDMLGYRFGFDFTVESGDKLGRKLNFPTINQPIPENFIKPRFGVYASYVTIDEKRYCAVTNIGVRPTVGRNTPPRAESYILDFSGDLYGMNIKTTLLKFLRDEKKFSSFSELEEAISRDAKASFEIFVSKKDDEI